MNLTLTNYPSYAAVHEKFEKRFHVFFRNLGKPLVKKAASATP